MRIAENRRYSLRKTSQSVALGILGFGVFAVQGASAASQPTAVLDSVYSSKAYADLIGGFWTGSQSTGHLSRYTVLKPAPLAMPVDSGIFKGTFWEYGQGINVLYAYWKGEGSADAAARLKAQWSWTKSIWNATDVAACGTGTMSTAQDDAAWGANAMLQMYEATQDRTALSYAKSIIDCAWNRWYDTKIGGGLWYSDSKTEKSSYQAPYAWAQLRYSILTGDTSYAIKAQSLDTWASKVLTAGRTDGLYWEGVDSNGLPLGANRPNCIYKANSIVFLGGNMAWAALDAQLFAVTGTANYKARAIATAAGIYAKEMTNAVLLDDRDAYTDGWAAYIYATNVVPLLTTTGVAGLSALHATGVSVVTRDRSSLGLYGGDWDGNAPLAWGTISPSYSLKVTANAVIWPIVAP